MPELNPTLELAEEAEFVSAAKAYLSENREEQQRLGVYHRTTCFRWKAASQHLKRIQATVVPFGINFYNYDPKMGERLDETVDSQLFELDARLFDYVVNARSTLDVLAHEINFVYWLVESPERRKRFFDPEDPSGERRVSIEKLSRLVEESPPDALGAFLKKQLSADWFRYLADLRDVAYHRRLLVGAQEGCYLVKDLLRIRPTQVKPVEVTTRLPDDPKAPWWKYTFLKGYELVPRLEALHEGLGGFLGKMYSLLAAKLQEEKLPS